MNNKIGNNVSLVRVSREARSQVDQLRSADPTTWFLRAAPVGFTALTPSLSQICNVRWTDPVGSFCPQISFLMGLKEGEVQALDYEDILASPYVK